MPVFGLPVKRARDLALSLAGLRALIGIVGFLAPTFLASPWIGKEEASRPGARLLARTLGGRDVALGLGAVVTIARGSDARGWVGAGALADGCDTVATLLAFSRLPRRYRFAILALTSGAAGAGALLAPLLNAEP